jgi:hypothetical protein
MYFNKYHACSSGSGQLREFENAYRGSKHIKNIYTNSAEPGGYHTDYCQTNGGRQTPVRRPSPYHYYLSSGVTETEIVGQNTVGIQACSRNTLGFPPLPPWALSFFAAGLSAKIAPARMWCYLGAPAHAILQHESASMWEMSNIARLPYWTWRRCFMCSLPPSGTSTFSTLCSTPHIAKVLHPTVPVAVPQTKSDFHGLSAAPRPSCRRCRAGQSPQA